MYQSESNNNNIHQQRKGILSYGKTMNTVLTIGIIILSIDAIIGVYHLAAFLITGAHKWIEIDFISTHNPIAWIIAVLIILTLFSMLRVGTSYLGNIVKFVFKIAQSDIVTIILALVVNVLLLWLNTWITSNVIQFIEYTQIESFFTFKNPFSVMVMFIMLAGALIWIPRLGTYGENRLGQFDDNN